MVVSFKWKEGRETSRPSRHASFFRGLIVLKRDAIQTASEYQRASWREASPAHSIHSVYNGRDRRWTGTRTCEEAKLYCTVLYTVCRIIRASVFNGCDPFYMKECMVAVSSKWTRPLPSTGRILRAFGSDLCQRNFKWTVSRGLGLFLTGWVDVTGWPGYAPCLFRWPLGKILSEPKGVVVRAASPAHQLIRERPTEKSPSRKRI